MVNSAAPYAAASGETEVERVVTATTCHIKEGIYAQMENIRAASLRHNADQGIHGVLVYQSGWFVHWAEGPPGAVQDLVQRLASDPRHHSPHTLHISRGCRLVPSPWSMMMSQSTEASVHFDRRVIVLRDQFEKGRQYSPSSVLRRLTAPMLLPQAQGQADPEAFHRIGICAAGGHEAFAMVAWLAEMNRTAVVKRRFAGEQDMDGSSEYVDFMEGGYPCRMIAVARNGLVHGIRRAVMPDWANFVMLFSGTARLDGPLMMRMVEACKGLPATPRLLGVAPDVATHQRMMEMAADAGLDYVVAGVALPDDFKAIWRTVSKQIEEAGEPPSSVWAMPAGVTA